MPGGETHNNITDAMIDVDSGVDEDLLQYLRDNPYALYQGVATAPALDFKTKKTVTFNSDLTPAQITANQDDYNPTGLDSALRLRLDTDASRTLTGLAGGASGRVIVIANIGSFDLVLADEDANSSAANRFHLEASTDVTIEEGGARVLQYDTTLSRWVMWGGSGGGGSGIASVLADTTPQLGGTLDTNSKSVFWSKGADVASGAALALGTDGNYFDVTGTTTITSINTWAVGAVAILQFDGILTLTHHATNLVLPTGANITTAAGDHAIMHEYAAGTWRCVSYERADGTALAGSGISNMVEDTSPQLGGALDTNSKPVYWSKGSDVASAAALTLATNGNVFDVTGTTAITSINTWSTGAVAILQFDGILTLTYHATNLILPTGANITTAAGDHGIFHEYGSGTWRCVAYQRADGTALVGGGGGLSNVVEDTTPQLGGPLDANGQTIHIAKGGDVTAATTLNPSEDGNYFVVTGNTAITAITSYQVGTTFTFKFSGTPTLTHHATNLILPTGANITAAAGDVATFVEYAAGTHRCISYMRADGTALSGGSDYNSLTFSTTQTLTAGDYDNWNLGGATEDIVVIDTNSLYPHLTGISVSQSDGDIVRLHNEEVSSGNTGLIIWDNVAQSSAANRIRLPNQAATLMLGPGETIEFVYDGDNSLWKVTAYSGDLMNPRPLEITLTEWNATEAVSAGDIRIPTTDNDYYFECTTAGTTGGSEPTWTTTEFGTTTDNTVTWTTRRPIYGQHYLVHVTDRDADLAPYELNDSRNRMWITCGAANTKTLTLDILGGGEIDDQVEYLMGPRDHIMFGGIQDGGVGELQIFNERRHNLKSIINRVQTVDVTNRSTASTSYVTSSITVTVNPVTKGSTIGVTVTGIFGASTATLIRGTLYRNVAGAGDSAITPSGVGEMVASRVDDNTDGEPFHIEFDDAHGGNTGESVVYTLYFKTVVGTAYIGRRGNDTTIDCSTVMTAVEYIS